MSNFDAALAAIEQRKCERIAAIQSEIETQMAQLRQQAQQQLAEELAALREKQVERLRSERERRLQGLREALQRQYWQEEQQLIASLQAEARQELAGMPPPPDYIAEWLAKAETQLGEHGALELRMPAGWCKAAAGQLPADITVKPQALLGGCILMDRASGRMVDGSWEGRLRHLQDAVWRRWRGDGGEDR